jgi:two-component system OmpR family sensor kinase
MVLLGMGAVAAAGVLLPWWVPAGALISAAGLIGWSAVGAAAVLLVIAGVVVDRPLPRRAGLAFGALAVAHGIHSALTADPAGSFRSSFTLGSIVMFLVAAGWFLVTTVRAISRQHLASHARLAEAEAIMAEMAERDHELRNLVAGLSGAASVLTGADVGSTTGGRDLLAAAGAEFDRLQRMLDGRPAAPLAAAVGPLLRDLALVHQANGLDVRVRVDGDPRICVDDGVLAQILANLLANCAQHAPGASVTMHASARGSQVRIEVVDDGPGLPAGSTAQVLRRGVRGPGSTGAGLGLAICTDLVERHRGTFTVVSTTSGCTAVLELPAARRAASPQAVNA